MSFKLLSEDEVTEDTCGIESEIEKRYKFVIDYFQKNNPTPTTELKYKSEYELLVAVILSARCRDSTVNGVTPALFAKYPDFDTLSKATSDDVYQYISSVTFPNNKSEYLVKMAKMILTSFNGKIPKDEVQLRKLPGVGRKTANVVAATLFNRQALAVDVHVFRVSDRIGLTTDAKTPLEAEEQLMDNTPKDVVSKMSHWLILHGRYICMARAPMCRNCGIKPVCRHYEIMK